jgi:hypothetical protein
MRAKLQNEPNFEGANVTSDKQIEANRRNALKSSGPRTEAGKEQSRRNAVRHGLTAETVIGVLEDAEDYRQFEAAVIADYGAQSAVERELVLRLASILWRLRRATTMETGLFEIQGEHLREYRQSYQLPRLESVSGVSMKSDDYAVQLAQCFLRLTNLPNFAIDRLSRYEATLWRQAGQLLYALEILDRRKPQERSSHFWLARKPE